MFRFTTVERCFIFVGNVTSCVDAMSKEREMIEKLCSFQMPYSDWLLLIADAEELLAQPEPEQQPEAWIIVNKETGYRTQVSDLTPFLYHREIFEVIPLYTAPPKREPLSEDKLDVLAEANITDEGIAGYYLGFRDAEKHHGIGGGE